MSKVLGLDVADSTIGVAVSDALGMNVFLQSPPTKLSK